jgi:hypothetical protein
MIKIRYSKKRIKKEIQTFFLKMTNPMPETDSKNSYVCYDRRGMIINGFFAFYQVHFPKKIDEIGKFFKEEMDKIGI